MSCQSMKFEDLLMQPSEEKPKIKDLKEEVEKLREELDGELQLKTVLQCALQGPTHSCLCFSLSLPRKVQMLHAELTMVEEEIIWLERKVDELMLNLNQEQKQNKEWEMLWFKQLHPQQGQWHNKPLYSKQKNRTDYGKQRKYRTPRERRTSVGSSMDIQNLSFSESNDFREEVARNSSFSRSCRNYIQLDIEVDYEKPNKLSEEIVKCLIGIFLELNQATYEIRGSAYVPKHTRLCMNSKGFISKTSFSCSSPPFSWEDSLNFDPYGILQDLDGTIREVGAYKNFLQITRGSINKIHVSECHPAMQKLRVLMHKLSEVDLMHLTNKQKLAFWINVYNASIMHAFLQHGFPSTQEKLQSIMNEAAINVGGTVLNSLVIEHFILRHPSESSKPGLTDEKEMLLRHAYGIGYPEPNVTFALCRGSWSSPALRVYTPDEVVNELERAKVEYLEASIGVTSKKKILVPRLMQWHMNDFADDMESLLEWIYSQLQQSGSLKRLIMECLKGGRKSPVAKMIEIQPYSSEFRYILSL